MSLRRPGGRAVVVNKVEPPRPEGRRFLDYAQRYSAHVSVQRLIPSRYVNGCVVVCIVLIPTGQAGKIGLGLAVIAMLESTLRANLTCILGVYRNQPSTSFCRFVSELPKPF